MIDGYTHNSTLTSGDSVPIGKQFVIVCRVVGLPYGTPLNYTWTCPNGPCEVEGYYGRKVYNEHILAVNTTSTLTHFTATTRQEVERNRLKIKSTMKWGRGKILLDRENKRDTTRSYNWRQWIGDSMTPCMEDTSHYPKDRAVGQSGSTM